MAFDPVAVRRSEGVESAAGRSGDQRREGAEAISGQGGHQKRQGGPVVVFDAAGHHPRADGTDPLRDAGTLAQESDDAAEVVGKCVGDVDKPEIGAFRDLAERLQASLGEAAPSLGRRRSLRSLKRRMGGLVPSGTLRPALQRQGSGHLVCAASDPSAASARPASEPASSRRTTWGLMRLTISATPAALGWMPSGWLRFASMATPSRKKG